MSDGIVKSTATWQGLKVDSYTNLRTGEVKLYQPKRLTPLLLARSTPGDGKTNWTFDGNGSKFRDIYNDQQRALGKKELSQEEFNAQFFTKGTRSFDGIRETILTDDKNYINAGISVTDRDALKKGHFDNRIPGTIDPKTKIKVNSDGTVPKSATTGTTTGDDNKNKKGGGGDDNEEDNRPPFATFEDVSTALGEENELNPRARTTEDLRYPLIDPPPEFKYDYISITAYDYVEDTNLASGEKRFEKLKNRAETVFLPMQPQISETNAVSWSDDQLNPIQKMMGNAAMDAIKALGEADLKGLGETVSNLGNKAGEIFKNDRVKKFATAYFAGQAVGANLVGRTTGMVINPNLELLFNGPNLRTFSFNFKLTPRYKEESEQIRKIIRAFKRNMAVQKDSSQLFLRSPRIFQLKYIYKNGGQHPYLNKFKPCALSNFSVNYTPDGSYATFDETGSLTAYEITMDFTEVIPIYDTDIPTTETTSMGY